MRSSSSSSSSSSGTRSGLDAARRLVDGRRALMDSIRDELLATTLAAAAANDDEKEEDEEEDDDSGDQKRRGGRSVRELSGHGVPVGLLRRLSDAARGWLGMRRRRRRRLPSLPRSTMTTSATRSSRYDDYDDDDRDDNGGYDRISFTNVPNTTLLDRERISIVNIRPRGYDDDDDGDKSMTMLLPSLPEEWEHDLEMYMVVMDRIGSRMASVATSALVGIGGEDDDDDDGAPGTAGSIVTPSRLRKWDVTIVRGGVSSSLSSSSSSSKGRGSHRRDDDAPPPTLSLEWASRTDDRWKVVLRLQDHGGAVENDGGGGWRSDSVSLVFEGEYVPP